MGRLPRPTGDDLFYHAINRGNNRADVLGPDGERDMFLGDLARTKAQCPFALFGYCLMSNHFPDRHGFWGGRRLRRFPQGAEVSVSKSELLVAEQVERADFSSADICSAKPPAVPEAVKRHRKPPGGRVLQGFHEPPPKSVTVRRSRRGSTRRGDRWGGIRRVSPNGRFVRRPRGANYGFDQ